VAGEPDLGRGRHWHDLAEEMVDPLPGLVLGEDARTRRRGRLVGKAPAEGGVALVRCSAPHRQAPLISRIPFPKRRRSKVRSVTPSA
jgi:hypothetical protein